jgi:hypothetical protein
LLIRIASLVQPSLSGLTELIQRGGDLLSDLLDALVHICANSFDRPGEQLLEGALGQYEQWEQYERNADVL